MKDHHSYPKEFIGSSDIATLITFSPLDGEKEIRFGEDGSYYAYIVDEEAEIPSHYRLVFPASYYLRIYDDEDMVKVLYGDLIKVYRAKNFGCIIQVINEGK